MNTSYAILRVKLEPRGPRACILVIWDLFLKSIDVIFTHFTILVQIRYEIDRWWISYTVTGGGFVLFYK